MRRRVLALALVYLGLTVLLVVKLAELQLKEADFWDQEALRSRTRAEIVAFRRGNLLDREGRVLATSESSYDLLFVYGRFRASTLGQLAWASYLLFQDQPRLADLRDRARMPIDRVLATEVASLSRLESRDRRRDVRRVLLGLTRLKGKDLDPQLRAAARSGLTLREAFPALADDLERRAHDELGWLARLGALLDVDLVQVIDQIIERIDGRVQRALERRLQAGGVKDQFVVEKALHNDLDHRADRLIASRLGYDVVDEVAMNPDRYLGFEIREVHRRFYPEPYADIAPQLIGVVGAPEEELLKVAAENEDRLELLGPKEDKSADEMDEMRALETAVQKNDYRADEEQGREGLERTLEPLLRGQRGYRKVERDILGQGVKTLDECAAVNGQDVRLTLDAELQLACEELLAHADEIVGGAHIDSGALVMLTPPGEVLAVASSPRLARGDYRAEFKAEIEHPSTAGGPLHHRAYAPKLDPPPGSVFKPFVAIAGLSAHVLDPEMTVCCDFGIGTGQDRMKCLGKHDDIALRMALAKSCNAYFGHAGELLGDARLRAAASLFGFTEATHFATNGLDALAFPAAREVLELHETGTRMGPPNDSISCLRRFGCGQGTFDDVTPLQVARAYAGLATGELPRLRLVLAVGDAAVPPPAPTVLPVERDVLETVRSALEEVVGPEGTARPQNGIDLRRFGVVGKSGTATVSSKLPDDAWFAGYLPREHPTLVVVLLLEHASLGERSVHGGEAAVPLLGALFQDARVSRYLGARP